MKTLLLGDICANSTTEQLYREKNIPALFGNTASLFKNKDLVFANIECAITDSENRIKKFGPNLKSPTPTAEMLKELGVTVCGLSNNHIFDFGKEGAIDTINAIEAAGMDHTGFGENLEDSKKNYSIEKNGEKICYDYSIEHSRDAIDRLFDGDGLKYAAAYYENMANLPRQLKGDFVGHFDLLTKYEVKAPDLFDTGSPEYRKIALEALVAVREGFEFFEVNTGPIGRGYKPTPYPAPFILDEMRAQGCKLIITTDCHNKDHLDCGFSEAVELVRAHGFTEIYELTDAGFAGRKI